MPSLLDSVRDSRLERSPKSPFAKEFQNWYLRVPLQPMNSPSAPLSGDLLDFGGTPSAAILPTPRIG